MLPELVLVEEVVLEEVVDVELELVVLLLLLVTVLLLVVRALKQAREEIKSTRTTMALRLNLLDPRIMQ